MTGAENQQERPYEFRGWVVGFVDGEGCFSIGVVRQQDRAGRRGYRIGYQVVAHEFAVTQGAQSVTALERIREFFGVGQIVRESSVRRPSRASVPVRHTKRSDGNPRDCSDDEPAETQARAHRNPQRLYARDPGHRVMR